MPIELKPCPACSEPSPEISNTGGGYYARCPHCCMRGPEAGGPTWTAEAWNDLPRRLRWAKEPPKEPGWYWWRWCRGAELVPLYVRDGLIVEYPHQSLVRVVDLGGEWAGPIPEPEE